jgi:hypothetical protein
MGTPYNPEKYIKQKGIVENLRTLYKRCINEYERPLTLEDADIWDSYDSFGDAEAGDTVFPELKNRYDAMVLDDMRYKQEIEDNKAKALIFAQQQQALNKKSEQ